jgi:hypothetical protein
MGSLAAMKFTPECKKSRAVSRLSNAGAKGYRQDLLLIDTAVTQYSLDRNVKRRWNDYGETMAISDPGR